MQIASSSKGDKDVKCTLWNLKSHLELLRGDVDWLIESLDLGSEAIGLEERVGPEWALLMC